MVVDSDFSQKIEGYASDAIQRAFERLIAAPPHLFDDEVGAVAHTLRSCCERGSGEMNQYFAALLIPAFNMALLSREPFEYEFSGNEDTAHRVKCTAAVFQRLGWGSLNLYAKRWARMLIHSLVPEGHSPRVVKDLCLAKTYAGYLCDELLPVKKRDFGSES